MYKRYRNLLVVFLILVFSSCGRSEKSGTSVTNDDADKDLIRITSAQFEENQFELGGLQTKVFRHSIQVSGMIDVPPQNKAVISIPVGGYITDTKLLIGDKVQKGQVLATLENPEFIALQQKYLETKQQLGYLEAEYKRHHTLYKENITSQKNFLKAESDYKMALATYTGLKEQLRILHISTEHLEEGRMTARTHIYAPISGSISKLNITKGAFVSPATEILEIINTEHIHLELLVFERDIIFVKEGQKIEFRIPEASNELYPGKVYRVGSAVDENRRILVHGHIESLTNFNLVKGMFVDAMIITDSIERKALPENAVVEVDDSNYVLKLQNEVNGTYLFEPLEVETFENEAGFIAVNFKAGDQKEARFLTNGAFSLLGN